MLCLCRCVPSCARRPVPVPGHHPDAHWGCPWCWTAAAAAGCVHGGWGSPATTSTSATPARDWSANPGWALDSEGLCASVSRFAGRMRVCLGGSRLRGPESKRSSSLSPHFRSTTWWPTFPQALPRLLPSCLGFHHAAHRDSSVPSFLSLQTTTTATANLTHFSPEKSSQIP